MVRSTLLLSAATALAAFATPARAALPLVDVDGCYVVSNSLASDCTMLMTGGSYGFSVQSANVDAWATVTCGDGSAAAVSVPNPDPAWGYFAETTFTTSLTTCTLHVSSVGSAVGFVYH
jgi:uncharacterized membrane protein